MLFVGLVLLILLFGCTQPQNNGYDDNPKDNFVVVDGPVVDDTPKVSIKKIDQNLIDFYKKDFLDGFKLKFVAKMTDYFTFSQVELRDEPGFIFFNINSTSTDINMVKLKEYFEEYVLLSYPENKYSAVSARISEDSIQSFDRGYEYNIAVSLLDETSVQKDKFSNVLAKALSNQNEPFLVVNNCNDQACPEGTFDFVIDLSSISDSDYNDLPKLRFVSIDDQVVVDESGSKVIEEKIVPALDRQRIVIHFPLRLFKALYEAKKTALAIKEVDGAIANYKLGFCDSSCMPRGSVTTSAIGNWNKSCPTAEEGSEMSLITPAAGINTYFTGGLNSGSVGLKAISSKTICDKAISQNAFSTDDPTFVVSNTNLPIGDQRLEEVSNCGINSIFVATGAEPSKQVSGSESVLRCGRVAAIYADVAYVETNPAYIPPTSFNKLGPNNYSVTKDDSLIFKIRIEDSDFTRIVSDSQFNTTSLPVCISSANSCSTQ
jgi:hypothetical protein